MVDVSNRKLHVPLEPFYHKDERQGTQLFGMHSTTCNQSCVDTLSGAPCAAHWNQRRLHGPRLLCPQLFGAAMSCFQNFPNRRTTCGYCRAVPRAVAIITASNVKIEIMQCTVHEGES